MSDDTLTSITWERDEALAELVAIKGRLDGFLRNQACADCEAVIKQRMKSDFAKIYALHVKETLI